MHNAWRFFVTSGLHRAGPFFIRRNKRLYEVAGLTVDPDLNRLVFDFVRKLEDELLHLERWYDQMFYFVRSEMECYTNMRLLMQDIEEDEDWGPTILDESEAEELIDDV